MKKTKQLRIESHDYAWGECHECGNTIKFGGGDNPRTTCPACGCRFIADRKKQAVSVEYSPSDEEFWAEQDDDDWDGDWDKENL